MGGQTAVEKKRAGHSWGARNDRPFDARLSWGGQTTRDRSLRSSESAQNDSGILSSTSFTLSKVTIEMIKVAMTAAVSNTSVGSTAPN